MRMMLKVVLPTDTGNAAVKDGSLSRILDEAITRLNAEAAYFGPSDGSEHSQDHWSVRNCVLTGALWPLTGVHSMYWVSLFL